MRARVVTPAAVAAAVAVVAIVAAVAGPVRVGEPVLPFDARLGVPSPEETATGPPDEFDVGDQPAAVSVGVVVLALVIIGVVLTALVVAVTAALRAAPDLLRALLADRRREPPDDPAIRITETLRDAADDAARDVAAAPPGRSGDAVIACWVSLEQAAQRVGTPRDPSATPTEFTAALLSEHSADPDAVRTLLRLYHRARFARGRLPDEAAVLARDALQQISAGLPAAPRRGETP